MNRNILLLSFILVVNYLFSQNDKNSIWVCDTIDILNARKYNWVNSIRIIVKNRNDIGKQLEKVNQTFIKDRNIFVNEYKYIFTYNFDGKIKMKIYNLWDIQNGIWLVNKRELYYYNEDGKLSKKIFQNIIGNKLWCGVDVNKVDEINKITNKEYNWINNKQQIFAYNNEGNIISEIIEDWDVERSHWIKSNKVISFYNNYGLIKEIEYYFNININKWQIKRKEELSYNIDSNISTKIIFRNNINTGKFGKCNKESYYYDERERIIEKIISDYDNIDEDWFVSERKKYKYDSKGNIVTNNKYIYNFQEDKLILISEEKFFYNQYNKLIIKEIWKKGMYGKDLSRDIKYIYKWKLLN